MAIPFKNCLCEEKTDYDSHSPSNNSKQTDLTEQKKHPNDLTLDQSFQRTSKHFNILKSSELRLERKLEISGSSD
jgi:hypothetical protein